MSVESAPDTLVAGMRVAALLLVLLFLPMLPVLPMLLILLCDSRCRGEAQSDGREGTAYEQHNGLQRTVIPSNLPCPLANRRPQQCAGFTSFNHAVCSPLPLLPYN